MAGAKIPNFGERATASREAKQRALEKLRNKPALDPEAAAARAAALEARETAAAERRAAHRAAIESEKAARAEARAKAQAEADAEAERLAAARRAAPIKLIGIAEVPGGPPLRLFRRGADFMIVLDRNELMSTRMSGSEVALGTMTCDRLAGHPAPRLLIGGYGMGFTLRAVLDRLGPDARITVAELVPGIIEWARGPMADLTAGCLDDPRVALEIDDVGETIRRAAGSYDAIMLDVDNGPDGLTRHALKPGGVLAVWSAAPDPVFARRLSQAGFGVDEVRVRARDNGKGATHIICAGEHRIALTARDAPNERPEVLLASPYVRARETARLFRAAGGGAGDEPICLDERLREKEFGILDGLTTRGIAAIQPDQAEFRRLLGKFYHRPPGGESWCDVVVLCLRYVIENMTEEEIIAIDRTGEVANCSVTEYRFDPTLGASGKLALVRYNDVRAVDTSSVAVTAEPDAAAVRRRWNRRSPASTVALIGPGMTDKAAAARLVSRVAQGPVEVPVILDAAAGRMPPWHGGGA
ncbi:hypothetical protein GTA08_BOTSDO14326 [Botryosphaeria dothidea]|uniref:Spermidine synthase n=1 Tax=Botryosphaeria dothidea TaxID=55169 RepID=A0A8H4MZL8_9PEZI|nr:hypothetical protein GTA08_BOTSDO14326 [Botryosphaeria dothidea]